MKYAIVPVNINQIKEYHKDCLWVLTPNKLLNSLGFNPVEMENLRNKVVAKDKVALKVYAELENYRGWWESEMESLLVLQHKHPWLKDYDNNKKFDFNIIGALLKQSRDRGILNHYIDTKTAQSMISSKRSNDLELPKNISGLNDEII